MNRVKIAPEYQPYILKEYRYWTLLLNERQRYLGRVVVWLAREGKMQRFSGLSQRELMELQRITLEYESALNTIGWKPDHMNYLMLGNFFHEHEGHAHLHIIPRYRPRSEPIIVMDTVFEDDRWGKNCTPETPMLISSEVILGLVSTLKNVLL